jgi:hypothetical protein
VKLRLSFKRALCTRPACLRSKYGQGDEILDAFKAKSTVQMYDFKQSDLNPNKDTRTHTHTRCHGEKMVCAHLLLVVVLDVLFPDMFLHAPC